jgi:cell wall-associated NlpC family hydrolase
MNHSFKLTTSNYIFLLTLIFLISSCTNTSKKNQIETIIQEVKDEFVPDSRDNKFEIEILKENNYILKGYTTVSVAKDDLLLKLSNNKIEYIDSIEVLPSKSLGGKIYGLAALSVSNVRSRPAHSSELATQVLMGTPIDVYLNSGDWYLIKTPEGYFGWMDSGGFVLMNAEERGNWDTSERIVLNKNTSLLSASDQSSSIENDLVKGDILKVLSKNGSFIYAALPDNRTGYISNSDALSYDEWLNQPAPTAEDIINTAKQYMGVPYLWGGTSPYGFDCSGFTKTVFFNHSILLNRDASQQIRQGTPIEVDTTLSNILPGDLLFFGPKPTEGKRQRITHVAIYLGEGKIIHATGRVKIQSLRRSDPDFAEDRLRTLVGARRIIPQ